MKHQPIFDISGIPPSKEEIDQARARASKIKTIQRWDGIPILVFSILVAWISAKTFWVVYVIDIAPTSSRMAGALAAVVLGMFVIGAILHASSRWDKYWLNVANLLAPLTLAQAERALALVEVYPEIDGYRKKVVSERTLVNGDFKAMEKFESEAKERNIRRAIDAKRETAIIQLHTQ